MKKTGLLWFLIPAIFVVICFSVGAYHWLQIEGEIDRQDSSTEANPLYFYWQTTQVIRQFDRVADDLNRIANGDALPDGALSLHTNVAISGINILIRPSELSRSYSKLPGYSEMAPLLREFSETVLPSIPENPNGPQARDYMRKIDVIKQHLNRLSDIAWTRDNLLKEKYFRSIRSLKKAVLIVSIVLILAILSFILISISYFRMIFSRTRAVEAAEAAVSDKVTFLAMVSHELRTSLQVIISALDLLEKPQEAATRVELNGRIRRAANSLAVQLRDMLTLARAQTGYIELQPFAFEARELVHEVVRTYLGDARAKNLEVQEAYPDQDIFVVADGERIGQILHNLISNSIKYTSTGHVRIEIVSFNPEAGMLTFRISDTGPGLPPRVIKQSYAAKGLHSLGQGRGIGLSVVHTLATQLDARIAIRNQPDHGTIFDVTIPVVAVSEQPSKGMDQDDKRVLVVDDETHLLTGLSDVLQSLGYSTDTANSGMSALNHIAAHRYSAIFIDLNMPVMSGPELAAHIRKTEKWRKMKLIGMSAASHQSPEEAAHFDVLLVKPLHRHQLTDIIRF
ncbi:hybrid sensor histidine kinase/response regulator [Rhizobium paknamense]|uniref:histidine kinase n=1 Tax=Rhizobium paknamense TaxID=1206817 RepID=A0ABU0IE43_9HYPH|nr:hybrid sensor histidine kinase/response regulator [Rhizobium paknamense]MDQ0455484.1 signal transduction histidine kinase/CheY-like chemotaxis protein [Rhizobium paknamense]